MIIAVRLMGGLVNMLHELAFGESMSKKYGCDVVYTNLKESIEYNKRNYAGRTHADEYLRVFPNIDWTKNQERIGDIKRVQRVPFHYVDIIPENGVEYVGYFQSYKYWYSIDFVRWLIFSSVEMAKENSCFVHVRRADYLHLQDYHTVLGMDYYQTAVEYMERHDIEKYYIFSDDQQWCKENFVGDQFVFIGGRDYTNLRSMVSCRNGIISNSSFSLLAGLLNPNPSKVIISPLKEKWFGPKCTDSTRDLIPDWFIQI